MRHTINKLSIMYLRKNFLAGIVFILVFTSGCSKKDKATIGDKMVNTTDNQSFGNLQDGGIVDTNSKEKRLGAKVSDIYFSSTSEKYLVSEENIVSSSDIRRILNDMEQITQEEFARYSIPAGPGYILHGGGKTETGVFFTWILYAGFAAEIHFSDGGYVLQTKRP